MTGIFRLWNQDKGRYLKFDCTMSEIQNGRIKLSDNEGAEVLGSRERALEYLRALNTATREFFYDGAPWRVLDEFGKIIEPPEVIESNKLMYCATCGQDLTERVCDHIGGRVCPTSGLPLVGCGCEDCTHHEPRATLAEDAGEPEEDEDEATAIKPKHYARGAGGATFDVIEALYQVLPWEQFKGYMKGNIIKYTVRYDDKNGTEDVEKAAEYNRRLMAYEVREGAKNAS